MHAACFTMAFALILGEAKLVAARIDTAARVTLDRVEGGFEISAVHLTVTAKIPGADQATFEALAARVAAVAGRTRRFGRLSPYVETISYSATFFFHLIPGITETATRLPLDAPLVADREAPELKAVLGIVFVLFLIGAGLQAWRIRGKRRELVGETDFRQEAVGSPGLITTIRRPSARNARQ